jgi:hypothetical protein
MKLEVRLAVPDQTKSYLYGYERKLQNAFEKILKGHPNSNANKGMQIVGGKPLRTNLGYDDEHGQYIYLRTDIANKKADEITWLE